MAPRRPFKTSLLTGRRFPRASRSEGFTLIELLLVIVLLGVVAAMTVPNLGKTWSGMLLTQSADDAAYLMRYAQERAILKRHPLRMVIVSGEKAYWLEEPSERDIAQSSSLLPENLEWARLPGSMGRAYDISPALDFQTSTEMIHFFSDGRTDRAELTFCHKEKCRVVASGYQRGKIHVTNADRTENPDEFPGDSVK